VAGRRPNSAVTGLLTLLLLVTSCLCAQAQEQRSVELGHLLIAPAYVDTGPFAAAQEGAWYPGHGARFVVVIVKTEILTHGTVCSEFTAHLRVDSGAEYDLLGTQDTNIRRRAPPTIALHGEVKWPFQVKENERPLALILRRDTEGEKGCYQAERSSAWLTLGSEMVSLPLDGLAMAHDLNVVEQAGRPVRLGQLEIATTAVGVGSALSGPGGAYNAKQSHHFVLVCIGVKNVGNHPSCSFIHARLIVDWGYEYGDVPSGWFPHPRTMDLLEGEESGGIYVFEPHDGTIPTTLVLERNPSDERICADRQHRPLDMTGGARVRIHLDVLPRPRRPK